MRKSWIILLMIVISLLAACQSAATPTPPPVEEVMHIDERWDIVRWSPDGTYLALVQHQYLFPDTGDPEPAAIGNGPIIIIEVASGRRASVPRPGIDALWAPDSSSMLITSKRDEGEGQQYWLYHLTQQNAQPFPGIEGTLEAWDGSRLLYETAEGVMEVPVQPGDPVTLGEPEVVAPYQLSQAQSQWFYPAPDLNTFMVYEQASSDASARWWLDSPSGAPVEVSRSLYSLGTCCKWSPDGNKLAFFVREPEPALAVIDHTGSNYREILTANEIGDGALISMDFSPSGEYIALEWSASGEGYPFSNTQLYLVNVESGDWHRITEGDGPYRWPDWSPAENLLTYFNEMGEVHVLSVSPPQS